MTENIFGVVFVHFARGLVAHSVTPRLKWTPSATRKPASSFPSTSVARPPPTLIWARLVRLQYCKSGFEDEKGSNFIGSNMDRKRKLVCSWGFFPPSGFFSLPSHGICEGEPRKCGPSHFATWKINRENNNNNNNKQICEAIFSPRWPFAPFKRENKRASASCCLLFEPRGQQKASRIQDGKRNRPTMIKIVHLFRMKISIWTSP